MEGSQLGAYKPPAPPWSLASEGEGLRSTPLAEPDIIEKAVWSYQAEHREIPLRSRNPWTVYRDLIVIAKSGLKLEPI